MSTSDLRAQIYRNSPHEWRVLEGGQGAPLLFLHGAGGSAESFGGVLGALVDRYRVFAPDLPGHGGTRLGTKGRSGLIEMAEDVASLVGQQFERPHLIVGHSAGAAIALHLSTLLSPRGLFLINPALDPFSGVAGWAFPALARGLSVAPFTGDLLAGLFGRERRISELLDATGSAVSADMKTRYLTLAQDPQHIRGTLAMMAAWDVGELRQNLRSFECEIEMLVGQRDTTISPSSMTSAAKEMVRARVIQRDGGHLVHEEAPRDVATLISDFAKTLTD